MTHKEEDAAHAKTLRTEADKIRLLTEECRRAGITLEDLPVEIARIRALLKENKPDAALDRIREIKLPLLAEILLREPDAVPPAAAENPPVDPLPDEALSEGDRPVAPGAPTPVRRKPRA